MTDADLDRIEPIQVPGSTAAKLCQFARQLQRERDEARAAARSFGQQLGQAIVELGRVHEKYEALRQQVDTLERQVLDLTTQPAPPPPPKRGWFRWTA